MVIFPSPVLLGEVEGGIPLRDLLICYKRNNNYIPGIPQKYEAVLKCKIKQQSGKEALMNFSLYGDDVLSHGYLFRCKLFHSPHCSTPYLAMIHPVISCLYEIISILEITTVKSFNPSRN